MLIETRDGYDYSPKEAEVWLKEAGFTRTEHVALGGPTSFLVAFK
jgi:hypothetical protein